MQNWSDPRTTAAPTAAPSVGVPRAARDAGRPIVALESSVLAQGLPIPANRDAADRMTGAVARAGAVPAVTAVVRGVPTLGLEPDAPSGRLVLRPSRPSPFGELTVQGLRLGEATFDVHLSADGAVTVRGAPDDLQVEVV